MILKKVYCTLLVTLYVISVLNIFVIINKTVKDVKEISGMKKQNIKIEDSIKRLNSKIIKKEINARTDEIIHEISKNLKELQIKNLKIQKMDKDENKTDLVLYFEAENYKECIQQTDRISKTLDNIILTTSKNKKKFHIQELTVSNATTKKASDAKIIAIMNIKSLDA